MHIVHVTHSFYPRIGGIERAVQYLAEEQAKLGHDVTVVTSSIGAHGRPKREVINGVEVIRVKSARLLYNDLTIPLEEPDVRGFDIIHAHSQNSLFALTLAGRLKKKVEGKVAFYFMAVNAFSDHPSALVRFLGPCYGRWSVRRALEISDLVIVKSRRDWGVLRSLYNVEPSYVPDGVPEYYFTAKKKDPEEFRRKFSIKQEKIFLFIGRLHKLKGPHVLVKALKYVNNKDIAVVFIGPDAGYKKQVIETARKLGVDDRVYVLGYLSEEDKIHAIDSSIAVVVPSLSNYVEVYSLAISEAWARSKPVIASSIGEIPFRVRNYENGILVNPSDPIALARAMNLIAENPHLAEKLGWEGRKDVRSWKEIANTMIKLYETCQTVRK